MGLETVIFGFISSLVLLFIVLPYIAGIFTGASWRRFAQTHQFEFLPVRPWRARHKLKGRWKGWPVTISVQQIDRSREDESPLIDNVSDIMIPAEAGLLLQLLSPIRQLWGSERMTVVEVGRKNQSARTRKPVKNCFRGSEESLNRERSLLERPRPLIWTKKDLLLIGEKGLVEEDSALKVLLARSIAEASARKMNGEF